MDEQALVFTPSDFVDIFNQSIDYAFPAVVIEGELSNFKIAKDMWVYFDIKDTDSSIKCFGTKYMLPGPLESGMMVRIVANPRLHPQFNFSLQIQSVVPVGAGAIAKQAELLYKKLYAEGLFLPERKRQLLYPPEKIALIASYESAAYADFVKVLKARWPYVEVDAYNTLVQGISAPENIAAIFGQINSSTADYDVVVLTRGGGSADDLAAFNDERVVRAVAGSRVPTIVAIGHEIDESLAELCADARASTPSNAAELLVPDREAELLYIEAVNSRLVGMLKSTIEVAYSELAIASDFVYSRLRYVVAQEKKYLDFTIQKLALLNPKNILSRGYTMIKNSKGKYVKSGLALVVGETIDIIFEDTSRKAKVL